MGDAEMIQIGDVGAAPNPVEPYVRARLAAGAPNQVGTTFTINRDDGDDSQSIFDAVKAKLAPFVDFNAGGVKVASFTAGSVPMTVTINPTLSSITLTLNGTFP